jgi:quercetin dioxygenase-like cupin family protein
LAVRGGWAFTATVKHSKLKRRIEQEDLMSTAIGSGWSTDLSPRSAPRVSYAYLGRDEGVWKPIDGGLEARDHGAGEQTDDHVDVHDIRPTGVAAEVGWRFHTGDFLFLYVRTGSIEVEGEDLQPTTLNAGDAIYLPPRYRHRVHLDPGSSVIEVTAPSAIGYEQVSAPEVPAGGGVAASPLINRDLPENCSADGGPLSRAFFRYRDLGMSDVTGGRIMLEVLTAAEPADRTGWHTHSMGQIAIILTGKAMIQVEEHEPIVLEAGSTAFIGSRMRHDVYDVDADYSLLEVYMPADWDTIPCPAPKNAPSR